MRDYNKISKIIHYCWFGGKDKPENIKKCIESWKRYLVDYEFMEWNEDNFDANHNLYVKEAYESKKFAFVSDYVRVYALYHYGGIYLDTDVEIFKTFDDLLHHDSFWGFEQENYIATSTMGSTKGNKLIKDFLEYYNGKNFIREDGSFNQLTNVAIITKVLEDKGLKLNGEHQVLEGIGAFYPQTYFSPYDYINCRNLMNENTYAIHYFYKSWMPIQKKIKSNIKQTFAQIIGGDNIAKLRRLVN